MQNRDFIDKGVTFPADFIAEGVDQTRGWFFTLHAIASMVFGSVAYKNVVSNGLVLDKNGVKMSKRLGNVIDPFETIAEYGADATRWYMISNAQPWDNLKFDLDGIDEVRRKFFGTLFNTYSFFALYANIDGFSYSENKIPLAERQEIDRWIISLLNSLVQEVDAEYSDYEPTNATRKIMIFVDEHLSNWYVRLCRRRFWKGEYSTDKIAAYQTLYECLSTISKLMAPVGPMFSDWLYKNLNDATGLEVRESVHLADFPLADTSAIDKTLEQRMDYAQRISSLVLSIRKKEGLRVRQPLTKILLPVLDPLFINQVDAVKELILSEVNVKEISYVSDASDIVKKKIKLNFKTLGKKAGAKIKQVQEAIGFLSQADIALIENQKMLSLKLIDDNFELEIEDVEINVTIKNLDDALDVAIDKNKRYGEIASQLFSRAMGDENKIVSATPRNIFRNFRTASTEELLGGLERQGINRDSSMGQAVTSGKKFLEGLPEAIRKLQAAGPLAEDQGIAVQELFMSGGTFGDLPEQIRRDRKSVV
jgi:isoleucyl-tRNA synthetase